jgi:hypothetical protein
MIHDDAFDDDDPRDDDGPWLRVATADMPIDVLLRRVDVYNARSASAFRDTIASDDDLTDAERAAILRKFAACIPWLQERARADAKRAHERLQAEASARAVPTSRLTH